MNATILGLGHALPGHTLTQEQALALARIYCGDGRDSRALSVLYRGTRIKSRNSAMADSGLDDKLPFFPAPTSAADRGPGTAVRMQRYESEIVPLALSACHQALDSAQAKAEEITHIIVVTCTGFFAPGLDVALIKNIELRPDVQRLQIGFMGCHGALNGLKAARDILHANADARVLLCAAELCSLHMQYGSGSGSAVANALFADGAAAVVIGRASGTRHYGAVTAARSYLVPDSEDAMTWRIGDHGFEMTLSARVPDLITKHLPGWMDNWLSLNGLTAAQIASWAVHPGGPRIVDAVEESLRLPPSMASASREILAKHGNMSSPTVLFILELQRQTHGGVPLPCVMLGFGPGLIVEGVLLR